MKRPPPIRDAETRRLPSPRRRPAPAPTYRRLMYIGGAVVAAAGVAMLPAVLTSAIYREWSETGGILAAAAVTVLGGAAASVLVGKKGEFTTREGFAAVGLAWFLMSAFGTLPYLLTGAIPSLTDAFFESAAGFTTTGSSIVEDPATLSHGILIWRSTTQWIGGMGVIVLSIAILPLLGVGGMQLARAEAPGPQLDRLTPRFRETAKRLWLLYVGVTALLFLLMWAGDMNAFEAVAHALTTMPTGGFGTDAGSIGAFSPYTQWLVIVFMFIAGTSFALHWRALMSASPRSYFRHPEFRVYLGICLAAVALGVYANRGAGTVEEVVRGGAFTAISLATTTGYATVDFGQWAAGMQIFAVGLMFVGGMAGSTAGAVKSFRLEVLTRAALVDLRRLVHPRGVFVTRVGDEAVPDAIVDSVRSFFLFYMFLFMTGTVVMGVIETQLGVGQDLATSVSAVASALGNIGPGVAQVGPAENYAEVPSAGKWLLSFLMITGRLEIFPVLLLFTRSLWRR